MSQPSAIETMFANALAEYGQVDILVNNAGIQHVAPIEDFPVAKWDAIQVLCPSDIDGFSQWRWKLPRQA